MNWVDKLLGRADPVPMESPVSYAPVIPRVAVNKAALLLAGLRKGMWVDHGGEVAGILTSCDFEGMAGVTLIKENGLTQMVLDDHDRAIAAIKYLPLSVLTQATIEKIPPSRYESLEAIRAMGYKNRGEL